MRTLRWTTGVGSARRVVSRVALVAAVLGLGALTPAPAQAANVGAGLMNGTVEFASPGLPPIGQPCRAVSFTLDGAAQIAVVFNTSINGYAGPVSIVPGSAVGASDCETTSLGGGMLRMTVKGFGPTGSRIQCAVEGAYTRVGTQATIVLGGPCSINNQTFEPAIFVAHAVFQPAPPSGTSVPGVNAPITAATFQAVFTIAPA